MKVKSSMASAGRLFTVRMEKGSIRSTMVDLVSCTKPPPWD